jgi:hypothetical protein
MGVKKLPWEAFLPVNREYGMLDRPHAVIIDKK